MSKSKTEFVELFSRHQGRIFGYIYALLQHFDDTEEVLQRTALVLWRKFDAYQTGSDFGRWACSVARLEALSYLREQRNKRVYLSTEVVDEMSASLAADDQSEDSVRLDALAICTKRLNGTDRTLLEMCYFDGQPVQEMATSLGRTAGSVSQSLYRIRKALLDCITRRLAIAEGVGSEDVDSEGGEGKL